MQLTSREIYEQSEAPQRDALRAIIETAFRADPVKTEHDLMALGMTHIVSELKTDLQMGRL